MTKTGGSKYKKVTIYGKRYLVHRVVWKCHHGPIPDGLIIHHVDGDPRNNNIENLRAMTQAEHGRLHCAIHPRVKTCGHCGKNYEPTDHRGRQKYCSRACFGEATGEAKRIHPRLKICEYCSKEFEPHANHRKTAKYCSIACQGKAKRIHPRVKTCLHCGKNYEPPVNRGSRKYCSAACSSKAIGEALRIHPRVKTCLHCGKNYEPPGNRGRAKYCSTACYYRSMRTEKTKNTVSVASDEALTENI